MNAVQFTCPYCRYSTPVPASAAGQQVACPGCAQVVVVGAAPPQAPGGEAPAPGPGLIAFACPNCGTGAQVPASYAGQQAKCSACATVVVVPAGQAGQSASPQAPTSAPGVIAFNCACGNRIEVAPVHAGTQGVCSACGGPVQVPGGPQQQQAQQQQAQQQAQQQQAQQQQAQQQQAQQQQAQQQQAQQQQGLIVFNCPHCQTLSQVAPAYAGQQCLCPTCGAGIVIPHQSTAALPQQPAQAPAPAQAPSLGLAPAPGLDLAEPEVEDAPEPEFDEADEEDEEDERPRRGKRGAPPKRKPKPKAKGKQGAGSTKVECMFCFVQIPASAEACPSCGMDLGVYAAPARGSRGGRKSVARGGGEVRVFEALKDGFTDFVNNALFCCIGIVVFQVATLIVAVICGVAGSVFAGMVGSIAGVVIAALGAVVVTMIVVTYLLQGLFAFWLACARDEEPSLVLLFTQPLSGGVSGFGVQVVVSIAYLGLSFGIGFMINTLGSIPGLIAGLLIFFLICCLLVLICGLAQIYIVDQKLGFSDALSAASAAVTGAAPKLLAYAALCLGALFAVAFLVGIGLNVTGIGPDPMAPALGKIILSTLIQGGVSIAFLSVLGTSLTRIYLQLSEG